MDGAADGLPGAPGLGLVPGAIEARDTQPVDGVGPTQAATPAAMRPPPAARRMARRLTAVAGSRSAVPGARVIDSGWGRAPSAGRVEVSMGPIIGERRRRSEGTSGLSPRAEWPGPLEDVSVAELGTELIAEVRMGDVDQRLGTLVEALAE
jgi:hypothetical protein